MAEDKVNPPKDKSPKEKTPEEKKSFARREAAITQAMILTFNGMLNNIATSRQEWIRRAVEGDSRRDIDEECGYYKGEWTAEKFQKMYEDNPIAARVNDIMAEESWQIQPEVYESENPSETTAFEQSFNDLSKSLMGGKSRFGKQKGNPLWEVCKRADRLCGIGRYGVILIGLDDGLPLSEPAAGMKEVNSVKVSTSEAQQTPTNNFKVYSLTTNATGTVKESTLKGGEATSVPDVTTKRKLLYLRVFPETLAKITSTEANPSSPRYGQPTEYELTLNDPQNQAPHHPIQGSGTLKVHWTRCLHLADNIDSSEVYGVPRCKQVRHRLEDLEKLYGGSGEMYWKGAFPGLSFQTHPSLGGNIDLDLDSIKDEAENYMEGLKRYLATVGIDVKSLSPQVVDPSPQIERCIEAICIKIGVPRRKFVGVEQGELASSQDDSGWKEKLQSRQDNYLTPRVIVPLVDRFIDLGLLVEPESYDVFWPDMMSQSTLDKARVAVSRTQAMVQYLQGNVQLMMTVKDYLVSVVGYTEAEAIKFFENVQSRPESELLEVEPAPDPSQDVQSDKAQDGDPKVRQEGKGRNDQKKDAEVNKGTAA
jgi:hypothetical protein